MYQMFVLYYTPIMLIILPILWNLIQYWLLYFNNWERKKKKIQKKYIIISIYHSKLKSWQFYSIMLKKSYLENIVQFICSSIKISICRFQEL